MNEKDLELIERYLNNELSEIEKQQAEKRLTTDDDFKKRLEVFREYRQMHSPQSASFRQLLDEVQTEYQHEQRPARKYWLIAASVSAIGLLSAIFFFILEPSAESQVLYAQYFELPADNLSVRGNEEQVLLNEAMAFYNKQLYSEAQQRFQQWLHLHSDSVPVVFYSAVSHMALGEMQQAIAQLSKISDDQTSSSLYSTTANWYLALAHLKLEQWAEARILLEELAGGSTSYASKAQYLLDEFP